MCFSRPGLQRLSRSVAVRSYSGALKLRPASGSDVSRFQPASAPAAEVLTGFRLRRAKIQAGLGLRSASGSSASRFWPASGFDAPRFWPAS